MMIGSVISAVYQNAKNENEWIFEYDLLYIDKE